MLVVEHRQRIRIKKYVGRTLERDPMVSCILSGFSWIPFKLVLEQFIHRSIISQHAAEVEH